MNKKCVLLVCLSLFCCVSLFAQSRRVTVHLRDVSLKELFQEIENQTTYRFSYRNTVIDDSKDVNVSADSVDVSVVLDQVLGGKGLTYEILSSKSIVISEKKGQTSGHAQADGKKVVSGVITDDAGMPVIGATILEKGTTNGTITDFDGNFSLTMASQGTLQISYIGYATQEIAVAGQESFNIKLKEDSEQLQEVVVTGYTTQRKADLTGAISVVSVDELTKQNENNPMKALQGRVPGMNITADGNPSGSTTIRIRGIGTLNNNDPLYIIDGVPTKAGMHELNGNDIESIQVLKDAASASIYGSRAANGVIIITTKKGKEGQLKVNFDASISASMYNNKMEVLNAEEYGQAMWQAYVNGGQDPNTNPLGYKYNWGYDSNGYPKLNGISMSRFLDSDNTVPSADTDWFDETTRTGIIQQYNVSVSNGSEKGSSFFSLGYYKNLGTTVP